MNEPIRVGLVGCGGISAAHVRGLQILREADTSNLRFTACCDVAPDKAKRRSSQIKALLGEEVQTFHSMEEMLKKEDLVDAVDICTDHLTHHTLAVKCLDAGRDVFVEKPLAVTIKAGQLMIDAAKRSGRTLAVAENYRRTPANRAINWCVRTGKIGKPRVLVWLETSYALSYWGWRHHRLEAGGGWIIDGGVHFADLFMYNVGEIEEVYAITKTLEPTRYEDWPSKSKGKSSDVEDLSLATLKFANGAVGFWGWSNATPGEPANHRVIHGDKGSISWNKGLTSLGPGNIGQYTASMWELVPQMLSELKTEEKTTLFPGGVGEKGDIWGFDIGVAIELWDFADSMVKRRKPEVDGELGLKAEAVPVSVYESALSGTPVKVRDVETGRVADYQREINERLGL